MLQSIYFNKSMLLLGEIFKASVTLANSQRRKLIPVHANDMYRFPFKSTIQTKRCAKLITKLAHLVFLTVTTDKLQQQHATSYRQSCATTLPNTRQTCPFNHTVWQDTEEDDNGGYRNHHDTTHTNTPLSRHVKFNKLLRTFEQREHNA